MYLAGECAARQCRAESSVSLPCVACHAACVYGEQRRAAGHPCWRQAARRRAGALRGTLPPPSLHWLARGAEPRSAVQAHCWYRRHLRVGWLKARDRPSLCLLAALSAACSCCLTSLARMWRSSSAAGHRIPLSVPVLLTSSQSLGEQASWRRGWAAHCLLSLLRTWANGAQHGPPVALRVQGYFDKNVCGQRRGAGLSFASQRVRVAIMLAL